MNLIVARLLLCLGAACALLGTTALSWAQSTDGTYRSTGLGPYPPNLGYGASGPMMMLTASKDHTLFSPIYTDYEDIDGDGVDDTTFKPTFRYYGYFDAGKCYTYNAAWGSSRGRFEPALAVQAEAGTGRLACPRGQGYWSGNFLNWATMTRLDVVRKTLYGGFRREDTTSDTTLEMALLSQDAHSFVKYYSGTDVADYTPFDFTTDLQSAGITICNRSSNRFTPAATDFPMMRVVRGNYSLWATTPGTVCNWRKDQSDFAFGEKVRAFYAKYGPSQGQALDLTAHRTDLPADDVDGLRASSAGPDFAVRVQACKAGMTDGERCQAYVSSSSTGTSSVVYKPIGLLQEFGSTMVADRASRAEFGLITGSFDSNLRGGALRKNIGSVNDEVDPDTGRFCHNLSSGRPAQCAQATGPGIVKTFDRIQLFDAGNYNATARSSTAFVPPREVANGEFASWGNPMSEMVVQALAYFAGRPTFDQPSNMGRDAQLNLPVNVTPIDPLSNASLAAASSRTRGALYGKGICRPMYVLAMSSGSVSFDSLGGSDGDVYGSANYFINANGQPQSLAQLADTIGDASHENVNGTRRSVGSASNDFGFDCTAKLIGSGTGVGTTYSAGLSAVVGVCPEAPGLKGSYLGAGAAFMANTHAIRKLGSSTSAELATSAGLTADTGANVLQDRLPASALRVKTYAASLAGGVARIEIPIGNTGKKVFITPESTWDHNRDIPNLMPGAMLTFRALRAGPTSGSGNPSGAYVVTWNDTQFGGDYDMDLVGFIRWELSPVAGQAGEYDLTVLTDVLGHDAGAHGSHGFSIIGTEAPPDPLTYKGDGRYLTHGSNEYFKTGRCSELAQNSKDYLLTCAFTNDGTPVANLQGPVRVYDHFAWPTSFNGIQGNVGFIDQVGSGPVTDSTTVSTRFRVKSGADAVTLRDPLWYMAKYGSFDTGEGQAFAVSSSKSPDQAAASRTATNWDSENNSGALCAGGTTCADGEPDGYFLARRPEQLELRLRQLLERISKANSTAPALSSAQLVVGSLKYVTEFNPDSFSGNVKAFALQPTGEFAVSPTYLGGEQLTAAASRQVITNDGFTGLPFQWGAAGLSIGTTPSYVQALLGTTSDTTLTAQQSQFGSDLVAYMRGTRVSEGTTFRSRGLTTVMGPVVNSAPWVQDTQAAARYTDADFPAGTPSYRSFAIDKATRASMLWVGANDGMLHGFRASNLLPVVSYVPSPLVARLSSALRVTNTSAVPLMDGSPFTADVLVPSATAATATGAAASTASATSAWRTYLFAPLGRGGRAVFALDVTGAAGPSDDGADSEALNEARASSIFKWVFTASDDADLGHGLLNPVRHNVSGQASQVVYLNNGKFAVLVPNGYNASTGRAALFIINAEGPGAGATSWKDSSNQPRGYVKLVPQATDAGNGLMGATWVDLDNNGTVDVVYATDLKGQVWKFDLRSRNPSEWRSALVSGGSAVPLFTARASATATVGLPITTAPVVSFPSFGGTMVSFGTGRAIESSDFPDTSVTQRFFTVWDKGRYAEDVIFPPAAERTAAALPRSATFLKRLLRRSSDGFVYQIRTNANGEAVDAQGNVVTSRDQEVPLLDNATAVGFDPAVNDGWFFEFPEAGEAVLSSPVSRQNFLLFTSVRPLSDVSSDQSCSTAPLGTVYGFNPINGLPVPGLLKTYVIRDAAGNVVSTVNAVGNDLGADQGGTVARDGSPLPKTTCDANGANCQTDANAPRCAAGKIASRFATVNTDINGCVPANDLRIQWREIPGMKTR